MRTLCFLAYLAIVSALEVPNLLQSVTALKPGQEREIKAEVGQGPHVGVGHVPHVGVGHVPHVGLGQVPYLGDGHVLRVGIGQVPHVSVGHVPQVGVGQVPHVVMGQVPHVSIGHVPHVGIGHVPQVGVGQVPQVGMGQEPHVGIGHVPQVGVGHLHGPVQSHTHREPHLVGQQVPQIHGSVNIQPQVPHNVQQVNKNMPQVPQSVHQHVGHSHQHAPHDISQHMAHIPPIAAGNPAHPHVPHQHVAPVHQHVAQHVAQDKLIELQVPHVHVSLPGIVPQNVAEKMKNLQEHVQQVMHHAQTHIPQVINHQIALKQKLKEEQNKHQVSHGLHEVQQVAHGQQVPTTHVGEVPHTRFLHETESTIGPLVGVDRKSGRSLSLEDEAPKKCDFKCPRLDLTICATHDKCVREFRSQCELSKWNCLNTKKIFLQIDDAECQDSKKVKCRPDLI